MPGRGRPGSSPRRAPGAADRAPGGAPSRLPALSRAHPGCSGGCLKVRRRSGAAHGAGGQRQPGLLCPLPYSPSRQRVQQPGAERVGLGGILPFPQQHRGRHLRLPVPAPRQGDGKSLQPGAARAASLAASSLPRAPSARRRPRAGAAGEGSGRGPRPLHVIARAQQPPALISSPSSPALWAPGGRRRCRGEARQRSRRCSSGRLLPLE
nr:CDC42 small effector protein 2 isoform X1 [Caretta caretta]